MPRKWMMLFMAMFVPVLALLPSGCVLPGDVGAGLIVTPSALDFGTSENRLSFLVSKNFTTTPLQPVVGIPTSGWIVVEDCNDIGDGCLNGNTPGREVVRVSVLRDRMSFGTNRGQVVLQASGATPRVVDVIAEDTLQASFTADRRTPQAGQPVQFTDLSLADEDILSRVWDFGDGSTSEAINPAHIYAADGTYSVSLTVRTRSTQETSTQTGFITVATAAANVDFMADRTTIAIDELVYFTNLTVSPTAPVLSYAWDFGDGGTSTLPNPNHQFRVAGPKTVTLTVTTSQGTASRVKQNYILVQSKVKPVAKIGISQLKPYVDIAVQFSDLSEVGSVPILSRVWEFGDGFASTEANPTHLYRTVGNFTVKLTVITEHGTGTAELPIEVVFKAPTAEFTVDDGDNDPTTLATNPDVFQDLLFKDLSDGGSAAVYQWDWDFGDGKSSSEKNPVHRYSLPGTYSVTLTVRTPLPSNNEDSETKKDYILVITAPTPAFSFAPQSVFTDQVVQFSNLTSNGSEPIVGYQWDFDGLASTTTDRSTAQNPTFTYRSAGTYNPTLTVTTALRKKTVTQTLIVDKAPSAEFSASPRAATTVDPVSFTDSTRAGTDGADKGIVGRLWAFGDGTTSTNTNPTHLYTTAGTYTVSLTVTYAHSGTGQTFTDVEEKAGYVTIINPTPPTAAFSLGNSCLFVGSPVSFLDNSTEGTRPTTSWFWQFGDGSTSTLRNPSHAYAAQGNYNVSLTVTSSQLPAGFNSATYTMEVYATNVQELDDFVNTPDPAFQAQFVNSFPIRFGTAQIATAFNIYMVSQTWRSAAEIYTGNFDGRVWNHNLTIIQPTSLTNNTGILLVNGGSRDDAPPTESDIEDAQLGGIAALSGSTVALLSNVPAQPIEFADEVVNGVASQRSEDSILAYSFRKYLDSFNAGNPDNTWPALFPMAKAAVRGMDVVQAFMSTRGIDVEDFIVLGGSKRGWTTWLTGITDCRVRAMAPIVIDLLNIDQSVSRQLNVYGDFAPTLADYQALEIFDRFVPGPDGNPPADGQALLKLVDPFEYRERVRIPKLLINATGDEFFLPDSSQFYIDGLKGENRLSYLPNTSHGITGEAPDLSDPGNIASVFTSWAMSVIQGVPRPTVDWTFPDANTINVKLEAPIVPGTTVVLWKETNPTARDFRVLTIGTNYTPSTLTGDADGNYVARVGTPGSGGFTAYFVQVRIPSTATPAITVPGAPDPTFVFSTPVRVVPDVYPFP